MCAKKAITDLSLSEIVEMVKRMGFKPYAAGQIVSWLYKHRVDSFERMTNLAVSVREELSEAFGISSLEPEEELKAEDGTRKFLFRCIDGEGVETVLIPAEDGRRTLCVSSQAGCAMGCGFCRTAGLGLRRNLTQGEILGQAIHAQREVDGAITNIVFMGMGEPLMNLDSVCSAVEILLDERAFGFSKRRITISTAGLLDELEKLTQRLDVKIAISLNAASDEIRDRIMPVNRRYRIADIMEFSRRYSKKAKHRVTFEYVLIDGINDSREEAARLVKLVKDMRVKINLIPYNPFPGIDFKAPRKETVEYWTELLAHHGIQVNVRASRGQDILAACGQLAAKKQPVPTKP